MYYVYILKSINYPERHYAGITSNLDNRLRKHNHGEVKHTSKYKPWQIDTFTAFRDKHKALNFEKYLKSHSGRAFAKKHY